MERWLRRSVIRASLQVVRRLDDVLAVVKHAGNGECSHPSGWNICACWKLMPVGREVMNTRTPCCAWLVFPAALVSPLVAQDVEFFTRRANLVLEQVASSCIAMSFSCQRFVDRACKKQPGSSGRSGTMAGAKHRFGVDLAANRFQSSAECHRAMTSKQISVGMRQCAATWADLRVVGGQVHAIGARPSSRMS
jgi:hypothetical protein